MAYSLIYCGYEVPRYYDSIVTKVIATWETPEDAIIKMFDALSEYMICELTMTIPFFVRCDDGYEVYFDFGKLFYGVYCGISQESAR